jgi:DNA-binding transcriptional MerR regulator/effector-binding domain-containing protein
MLSIGEFALLGQVSPRTIRHYGDVGILEPAHVDPSTGYRSYELGQLSVLRRILALRDLGVGLEQIRQLLAVDGELSVEQLRGMLRLRESEIAASISEQREQLRRVASYLDALERGEIMRAIEIVVKRTESVRIAETTGVAPGYGHENIGPVFEARLPVVWARLVEAGIEPGSPLAYYDWPDDQGAVVVHLGFDIGDVPLTDDDDVGVVVLPPAEMASVLHRASPHTISDTYEAAIRWIDANGYAITDRGRELTLVWDPDDPSQTIIELQFPVSRV